MNNKGDLITIVIPCKNEEENIGELLKSLCWQSIRPSKIIVSDADSTDSTVQIVNSYKKHFNIEIIKGGKVSFGRNEGAKLADTKYIIFIDADMELLDFFLLEKTINLMRKESYEMSTTNIRCSSDSKLSDFVYRMNNFGQHLAKFINSPFSTGAYMCITKDKFNQLGGFDEEIEFCEDYWLSKQIYKSKFGIVNSEIHTSDRRFKKMGYGWMIKNFIKSYLNRNNREYFTKDFKYWI